MTATLVFLVALLVSLCTPGRTSVPPNIQQELGPRLSSGALVVFPSTPGFAALNDRWTDGGRPTYGVIIVPATERDVVEAVQYANAHGVPFFATTGGHGTWWGLAALQDGMAIWLRNLTTLELVGDGTTARLGGGLRGTDVIHGLWALGKQTTTGVCTCASLAGPALGGGHGYLQGLHGLALDQIVGARVVLANGSLISVTSRKETADLLWALKGAGHNFGIVTEFTYKVYDVVKPNWAYEFLSFTGDKVDDIYRVSRAMMAYQPQEAVQWSQWVVDPQTDPVRPIIVYSLFYNGPPEELASYSKPLVDIGPFASVSGSSPYANLSQPAGLDLDGPGCQDQGPLQMFPTDVETYDLPGMRTFYETFVDMVRAEPALAAGSYSLIEQLSTQAVRAVPAETTAYGHRKQKLLISPVLTYAGSDNTTLNAAIAQWGEKMRSAVFANMERHTYVNYARGTETDEELYGHEKWRIAKLKKLKKVYDPHNKFGYFGGIAVP
ncbi:hypothetical protein QBC47DRAFT_349747 [Echria macrotheca]|uniref:FAD-binding PCMH-type domain-containing protein n=1 Tax=Echria macrotheca TaxID=438768 RepID=A0AAJ0F8B1_9PEZI|nr:hypothetical protein QBC47DRAFT_349747 [Echria macrotheca]